MIEFRSPQGVGNAICPVCACAVEDTYTGREQHWKFHTDVDEAVSFAKAFNKDVNEATGP